MKKRLKLKKVVEWNYQPTVVVGVGIGLILSWFVTGDFGLLGTGLLAFVFEWLICRMYRKVYWEEI